jgi:uncharacterized protein YbbK (DUF523 family)
MAQQKILLSACLAGVNCVYDGTNKFHPVFSRMMKTNKAIIFCPEVLGGLKIPHSPSEILEGSGEDVWEGRAKVFSRDGEDVTPFFIKGARKVLELVQRHGIKKAIMKSKSPSCGCGMIFDGTFSRTLVSGDGVTTALLKKNGIEVTSDVEYLLRKQHRAKSIGRRTKAKGLSLSSKPLALSNKQKT